MTLPDGTAMATGVAFATSAYTAFPILATLVAMIAAFRLGPRVVRFLARIFRF